MTSIATLESLLAVEELQQKQDEAAAAGPKQYEQVQEQLETEAIEERPEPEDPMDTDLGGMDDYDVDGDSDAPSDEEGDISDMDVPNEEDEAVDDSEIDKSEEESKKLKEETEVTTESFWGAVGTGVGTTLGALGTGIVQVASGLAKLGIDYGPSVAAGMYKGVSWLFSRFGELLASTSKSLGAYIEHNQNSVIKLNRRLEMNKTNLGVLTNANRKIPHFTYVDSKVIATLKIGNNVAFAGNVELLANTVNSLCDNLLTEIQTGYKAIEALAEMDVDKPESLVSKFLEIDANQIGMIQKVVPGYEDRSGLVIQYRYKDLLPGDVYVALNAPQVRNRDMAGVTEAYKASSMFLAINRDTFKVINETDRLEAYHLVRLCSATQKLINALHRLNEHYTVIEKLQPKMAYSVKKLFMRLADDQAKTRLSSSFIEPMFLRASFNSGVMLTGMMELNTYAARVAAASLKLVEDHLRKMA